MIGRASRLTLALGLSLCLSLAGLGHANSIGEPEFGGSAELGEQHHEHHNHQNQAQQHQSSSGGDSHYDQAGGHESHEYPASKGAPHSQDDKHGHHSEQQTALSPNKGDLAPMFDLSVFGQLMFSPFELVKKISDSFKLPQGKLIELLGSGFNFGADSMLTPVVCSLKIIEKVFVPDHCRLKLVCQIGSKFNFVKDYISKFSPKLFQASHHLKALSDGMTGQNCNILFKDCEPKLNKPYEELKTSYHKQ